MIDREWAKRLRRNHPDWTYRQIADEMGVSETSAWYALNPKGRNEETASGRKHTVTIKDELWSFLAMVAKQRKVGVSALIVEVLEEWRRKEGSVGPPG